MKYPEHVSVLHMSSTNRGWHLCQMLVISVIMKQSVYQALSQNFSNYQGKHSVKW